MGIRNRRATICYGLEGCCTAVVLTFVQSGCAVQEVYEDGDLVSRSVSLGAARLPGCDEATSTLVVTSALGAALGRDGLTLGYARAEKACIPLECKAVFWVENPAVVQEVRALIGNDE